MGTAVEAFGLAALDVKLLIDWMKADLASSNAGVRNAAIALLGTAHRQLGPGLAPMLSQHVKPALMTTLEATFKANPVAQVLCFPLAAAVGLPSPAVINRFYLPYVNQHLLNNMGIHVCPSCALEVSRQIAACPEVRRHAKKEVKSDKLCRWCQRGRLGARVLQALGQPGR